MPKMQRTQLQRGKALPLGFLKVDRGTALGNPFHADLTLKAYEAWIRFSDTPLTVELSSGRVRVFCPRKARERIAVIAADDAVIGLACWCRTAKGCHASVLGRLIDEIRDRPVQNRLPFEP